MSKPTAQAWILLISLAIIWGSSFILIKRGLVGLSPEEVGTARIIAASLFLLPFAFQRLKRVERNQWIHLLSIGFLGSLIPSLLFAFAQTNLESSITGVINALTPLFTVIVGWVIYSNKESSKVLIGILLSFVGCAILSMASSKGNAALNIYAVLVVLATLCYGLNINVINFHLKNLQALTVTSVSLLFSGPVALIYALCFTDIYSNVMTNPEAQISLGYVALLGVAGTAIALIMFNKLVQITTPVFSSSVTYLIPLVAVIWGIIDGEALSTMHFVGMGAILLGVYVTNRSRS